MIRAGLNLAIIIVVTFISIGMGSATGTEVMPPPPGPTIQEVQSQFTTSYFQNPLSKKCFMSWNEGRSYRFMQIGCDLYQQIKRAQEI